MAGADAGVDALRKLKHIVVVMMENRSFDHMLGYLSLEDGPPEVNGLTGEEFELDSAGNKVPVFPFDADASVIQGTAQPLRKDLDPDHSPAAVAEQLDHENVGFVRNYIDRRDPPPQFWKVPMGYYTGKDVPVYDHLARQYCVCDQWYSSVPGDTWPNRTYAVTGGEGERVTADWDVVQGALSIFGKRFNPPIYDLPAFTRFLGDDEWHWYSHDPATLRAIDGRYRNPFSLKRGNFSHFDKRTNWMRALVEERLLDGDTFLDDASKGKLKKISWIDPNFIDLKVLDPNSNDDHPPADIRAGQHFVFEVYDALLRSKNWDDTMLIVTYDEHGGFYDHMAPPPVVQGDGGKYGTYGVRVPALIAGPRVKNTVLRAPEGSPPFDHTSIIKTALLMTGHAGALEAMPQRVQKAPHLGSLLLPEPRADIDAPDDTRDRMMQWKLDATERRRGQAGGEVAAAGDGAGHPRVLSEFQDEFLQYAIAVHEALGVKN